MLPADALARPLASLTQRFAALPVDRAPLRRAAVLSVLLVVLVAGTRLVSPVREPTAGGRPHAAADAARQPATAPAETLSARPAAGSGRWTLVLILLAGTGGTVLWMRRRRGPAAVRAASAFEVIESHTLAPGHSLRLVACEGERLLLGVSADGVRLLRTWPRDAAAPDLAAASDPAAPSDEIAEAPPVAEPADEVAALAPESIAEAAPVAEAVVPWPAPPPQFAAAPPLAAPLPAPLPAARAATFADVLRQARHAHA